jgi:hypothetical protein
MVTQVTQEYLPLPGDRQFRRLAPSIMTADLRSNTAGGASVTPG